MLHSSSCRGRSGSRRRRSSRAPLRALGRKATVLPQQAVESSTHLGMPVAQAVSMGFSLLGHYGRDFVLATELCLAGPRSVVR